MKDLQGMRMALIGPMPPPEGGMANQTRQLQRLLSDEGIHVEMVRVNAPYKPAFIEKISRVRAIFRLFFYIIDLWRAIGRVQLVHIMSNSWWSWHLYTAPAVFIASLRKVPVVINYRGGGAEAFFEKSFSSVKKSLDKSCEIVVPSAFLENVFGKYDIKVEIVPNIIDLERFMQQNSDLSSNTFSDKMRKVNIVVTRNLEPVYDIKTAIRAYSLVVREIPESRLFIAGKGPEHAMLKKLCKDLEIGDNVVFTGRLDNEKVAELYQCADLMVNPSKVDNMPISILEALASGVPVVSTNVGGVPYLVQHDKTAVLVPPEDPDAMAKAMIEVLQNNDKAGILKKEGIRYVEQYKWPNVKERLFEVYSRCVGEDNFD